MKVRISLLLIYWLGGNIGPSNHIVSEGDYETMHMSPDGMTLQTRILFEPNNDKKINENFIAIEKYKRESGHSTELYPAPLISL